MSVELMRTARQTCGNRGLGHHDHVVISRTLACHAGHQIDEMLRTAGLVSPARQATHSTMGGSPALGTKQIPGRPW